jgi:hypothetical protein
MSIIFLKNSPWPSPPPLELSRPLPASRSASGKIFYYTKKYPPVKKPFQNLTFPLSVISPDEIAEKSLVGNSGIIF